MRRNLRTTCLAAGTIVAFLLVHLIAASGRHDVPVPLGLPAVPIPAGNTLTSAKVTLGERLFFDTRLSRDGSVSCATCHKPERFFADDKAFSAGIGGQLGDRNAPSVLNSAYATNLFWDGRSLSLEDQVRYPVTHPREMNTTQNAVVESLAKTPEYRSLFIEAFGDETVTWPRVSQAIASFERTLVSGNSSFDRYVAGDTQAISESARRGFELFGGRAGCIRCHAYEKERPFFSDFEFHNTGVGWADTADLARYEVSKAREDKGAFRTPSLRHVAQTAPYMHNGRLASLKDVVDYYARGGESNPFLDARIRPLALSEHDKADLIAFLESLTGEMTYRSARGSQP